MEEITEVMEEISEVVTDKIGTRNPNSASSSSCLSGSRSRSLDNPRFCLSSFAHNARVAATLGLCGALVLDPGGSPVVATFTFGLIIAYFFELLDLRTGGFFKVWGPLIAAQIGLVFRLSLYPSIKSVALAALCTQANFLIGVWASRTPIGSPLIVQRLLYALVPFAASSIFTWATISAIYGMFNVSYYIMGFNCVFYWLFAIPRASSFKSEQEGTNHGGEVPDENLVLNPLESCFLTLNLLFFPVLFHIASHYPVLLLYLPDMTDLFLLPLIPLLFLLYASLSGALWWVSKIFVQLSCFDEKFVHFSDFHFLNGATAMLVIHGSLYTRGAYSSLPLPLNYALVITIMFGGAVGAASLGMVSRSFCFKAITALAAVACAVGHPLLLILLPSVACLSSALFFTKKSVPSYFAFVVLGCLMVMWFVMENCWDLYVWLAGMSVKAIIILISAVPASAIMPGNLDPLAEVGLVIHALLLCDIENQCFSYLSVYFYGRDDGAMYPSYMVIVTTTLLGLVLVRRLFVDQRVRPEISWFLICLYSSKLIVLFITSKSVVWASAVLLLAISAPFFLYRGRTRGASQMKSAGGSSGDNRVDGELDDLREASKPVSKRKLKNELKRLQWNAMN